MAGLLSLLFGKKRRRTRKGTKKGVKRNRKGKMVMPKSLRKYRAMAKKYKIKLTVKRGGRVVGYRKAAVVAREIRKKSKKRGRKMRRGRRKKTTKTPGQMLFGRRRHRRNPMMGRKRRSAFGVGGSYMPLSSFMSPYPYSVDSSPPWI